MRDLRRKTEQSTQDRRKGRLEVGIDIPTPGEIGAVLGSLEGRWRPLIMTAIFTGLQASELGGLRWQDVDFESKTITVRQRADRFGKIGKPKSKAGTRSIPLPSLTLNTLGEWKLRCPKNDLDPVSPNGHGGVLRRDYIIESGLRPVQVKAGVVDDNDQAKYTGLHALRHFYASWCINRQEAGGQELPPKTVQVRMGHSNIAVTLDIYGHLFPEPADDERQAAAELRLVNATRRVILEESQR